MEWIKFGGRAHMPITNSREKFVHELADTYDAEHQFLEAMQKMQDNAMDEKLKTMLEEHMAETQDQIARLEEVFSSINEEPRRQPCSGAKGIIEEGSKAMEEAATDEIRDQFIVGGATKAEHYEMVSYADLIEGAEMLRMRKAVKLLTENRQQEVRAARRLERTSPRLAKIAA
jgi:ferritin-like metal-binding protein YciE